MAGRDGRRPGVMVLGRSRHGHVVWPRGGPQNSEAVKMARIDLPRGKGWWWGEEEQGQRGGCRKGLPRCPAPLSGTASCLPRPQDTWEGSSDGTEKYLSGGKDPFQKGSGGEADSSEALGPCLPLRPPPHKYHPWKALSLGRRKQPTSHHKIWIF